MKSILSKIDVSPSEDEIKSMSKQSEDLCRDIREEIKKQKITAQVFVGGSFAKGTLTKSNVYDIDIFVRFDWTYEDLSGILGKILKPVARRKKLALKLIHGSRDYFKITGDSVFEIIPVIMIKNPRESRNVMDLSYFHVQYVKGKLKRNKKLIREIQIAKSFARAQRAYGAESYIQGFSGYALECLIINYGSFEKMARNLAKAKEQIILDPEKNYKSKQDIVISLNDSKLHSPVVLIDPTWKERNVLAALSAETFKTFQDSLKRFIKKPSASFFEVKEIKKEELEEKAKKSSAEFAHIRIKTDRQPGDIAGTKMKKFSRFLLEKIKHYFEIIEDKFSYSGKDSADLFIVGRQKKQMIQIGPPVSMKKHVLAFKKKHKDTFENAGYIHAKIKIQKNLREFLKSWVRDNKKIKEMGISSIEMV
ncbi:nucleotidyltransferase domain-containing protein [Candidatus Pacearchaeota archaeon]|nr:nucleotidyltransferase domain-containing protein [Candidatus Pacearchaeota archaeon]